MKPHLLPLAWVTLLLVDGCCKLPPKPQMRRREFAARFVTTAGASETTVFEMRQGGVVKVVALVGAGGDSPAACDVYFQCPGCGAFPLHLGEQVVAPQTVNVMLAASGTAPVTCKVTVVD